MGVGEHSLYALEGWTLIGETTTIMEPYERLWGEFGTIDCVMCVIEVWRDQQKKICLGSIDLVT